MHFVNAFRPLLVLLIVVWGILLPTCDLLGQTNLDAIGLYGDSLHAPFYHGVASGEPTPHSIQLWTRYTPKAGDSVATLSWELAADSSFSVLEQSGAVTVSAELDWNAHVLLDSLAPNTYYYYRFRTANNQQSAIGRTRTAPTGNVQYLKFGVVSCSSIYSGYFNAYARLAERDNLMAIVHLGDYLYDFVDPDERVRVPSPDPINPSTRQEWRDRHAYYLLDPDLRQARRLHPFIMLWDNHDVERSRPAEGARAFYDWNPITPPDTADSTRIYRRMDFGRLADLHIVDVHLYRDDNRPDTAAVQILGPEQESWLRSSLGSRYARWRLWGDQKLLSPLSFGVPGAPSLGASAWDGRPNSRRRMLEFVRDSVPGETLILSGDAHISIGMDVPLDLGAYNPDSGGVALEFLPTSISRGNLDELGQGGLAGTLVNLAPITNPHLAYLELINHGYGLLHLTPDSAVAEFWHVPILEKTTEQTLAAGLVSRQDATGWQRELRTTPYEPGGATNRSERSNRPQLFSLEQSETQLTVVLKDPAHVPQWVEVVELATGRVLGRYSWDPNLRRLELPTANLTGWCLLRAKGKDWAQSQRFAVPPAGR